MNIYQKTVLALGALALIAYFMEHHSRGIELPLALGIIGMTVLIFFAVKNIGKE
jgi:putative effector of murein hydrolase LrgA (UPF0299 family)